MPKRVFITFLGLAFLITTGCGYFGSSAETDQDLTDVMQTAVTVVSSIADDLSLPGVAASSLNDGTVRADEFTCTGSWSACNNGVKTRSNSCNNISSVTYTKETTLSFLNSSGTADTVCSGLTTAGDSIVRTGTDTLNIPVLGSYVSTSTAGTNYSGTSIGGGATITKDANGYPNISIPGIVTDFTTTSTTPWNQTTHTDPAAPLVLNQLARDGRSIGYGTMIVDHNVSKFTANIVFSSIGYQAGCCYPISGTLTITLTGTRTGTASMTFSPTCGSGTLINETGTGIGVTLIACSSSIN